MIRFRVAMLAVVAGCVTASSAFSRGAVPIYKDAHASIDARVDDLFSQLTPDEKLRLLSGNGFGTVPIERLGVPSMQMADAGQGVRGGSDGTKGPATAFPCGIAMAASWDVDLVSRVAAGIGEEARNKGAGVQVMLGPAVNIQRVPTNGRDSEYFAEDPYLAGRMAVSYVKGMQSTGVSACVKHFACNNSEINRMYVNEWVPERALREIYLPAFEAAVKEGHAWAIMSAYNKVNGPHCSANEYLLTDVLKKGWAFDGLVMSDWGGVHESDVAQFGNDLEMPGNYDCTVPKLKKAMAAGKLSQAAVDESARRVLKAIIRTGTLDQTAKPDASVVNSPAHQALALEAAEKGIVLLKNTGHLLPLDRSAIHSIAVLGEAATDLQTSAGGSPDVRPFFISQPLDGVKNAAGEKIAVAYTEALADPYVPAAKGFAATYYKGTKLEGEPIAERVEATIAFDSRKGPWTGLPKTEFSARWKGEVIAPSTGSYTFTFTGDDAFRLTFAGKTIIDSWKNGGVRTLTAKVDLEQGKNYPLLVEYYQAGGDAIAQFTWRTPNATPFAEAAAAAKKADVCVVCVSTNHEEHEGADRESMDLPNDQDDLIRTVLAANPKTIVVLSSGSPVTMTKWIDQTPALVQTWFPGEQGGAALGAVLFGDVNPSGKLPMTFAKAREDYPDFGHAPGPQNSVQYLEGIYVGYRHFDQKKIEPLFPFGYGLSYSTFEYSSIRTMFGTIGIDVPIEVAVDVKNTGNRPGEEVVELYVHDLHPQIDKPVRELKGFAKVLLQPGESKPVSFMLRARDLAYFDVPGKQWKADPGEYDIEIGSSSRDIRQKTTLKLEQVFTESVPLSRETNVHE